VIEAQGERRVGRAEHDRVAARIASEVPYLELASEAEYSLVPDGAWVKSPGMVFGVLPRDLL
jgi:hypothetical protein